MQNYITFPESYGRLVHLWHDHILEMKLPAEKKVLIGPNDKGWDGKELEKACLKNLDVIDRFSREILSRHTVACSNGKMQVYIHWPGDKPKDVDKWRDNAFWSVTPYGNFGSNKEGYVGIGITNPEKSNYHLATSLDILAHEFGHSVISYTAKYNFSFQSGSLDESFADIFAIMVKHYHTKTTAEDPDADWCLSPGVIKGDSGKGAIRRIDPGKARDNDIQPEKRIDYLDLPNTEEGNWGGRHYNCKIPSLAFYHIATNLGGFCYERPGNIWMNSIQNGKPDDDFEVFAQRTIQSAKDLHYSHRIQEIVANAWHQVGVDLRNHKTNKIKI